MNTVNLLGCLLILLQSDTDDVSSEVDTVGALTRRKDVPQEKSVWHDEDDDVVR